MHNQAFDAEPPIASFLKSILIGGGPVNATVRRQTAMTTAEDRKRRPMLRLVVILGVVIAGLAYGIEFARRQAQLNFQLQQAEWRQKSFASVKHGDARAWVMDSKLLPMLANDLDCRRIVTSLDFTSTDIDPTDAGAVSQLENVSSMMFYCTTGTKALLLAARSLPITEIYFEMPDLTAESYLVLKDFPHLKKVRFEHVMEDEWIDRLQSELPDVIVDAPYPRSKEPGMAK